MATLLPVIIYEGRAYVPTMEHMMGGGHIIGEPIFIARLEPQELADAITQIHARGNPDIPRPGREELKERGDPMLRATGARSWRELASRGASYSLEWIDDYVEIISSKVDKKGRWVDDYDNVLRLPSDASMLEIAELVLSQWNSRSANNDS